MMNSVCRFVNVCVTIQKLQLSIGLKVIIFRVSYVQMWFVHVGFHINNFHCSNDAIVYDWYYWFTIIFVLYPHCFMKLPLLIESRTFTLHIFMSVCHKNINNTVYLFTVSFRMAEDVVGPRGRVVEGADSKTLNLASVRRPDGTIC